jgi:hypothetical protein
MVVMAPRQIQLGKVLALPFPLSTLPPAQQWLGVILAWPALVFAVYLASNHFLGPAPLSLTGGQFAWTVLTNGCLIGLLLAGHAALQRGVAPDLRELEAILPPVDQQCSHLERRVARLSSSNSGLATALGIAGGAAVATLDPELRQLYSQLSASDPRHLLFLLQNVLVGALGARLFATEVHMTRAYTRLGERVEIDLIEPSATVVFARKGLRSVIVWVLVSTAISMFWLLESAGQTNVLLASSVLGLAIAALVAPTRGVRRSIASAKARELSSVRRQIRRERDLVLSPAEVGVRPYDARLGDLLQYELFIRSVREWPFDLSIVARSSLFLVLGAGSWIGGAVVERLLGLFLD